MEDMIKRGPEIITPDTLHTELTQLARQLGELAAFLNVQTPAGADKIERLTPQEVNDLWYVSRASLVRVREESEHQMDVLIAQALATGAVFPVSREPRS